MSSKFMDVANDVTITSAANQTFNFRKGFGTPMAAIFKIYATTGDVTDGLAFSVGITDGSTDYCACISAQFGGSGGAPNADRYLATACAALLVDGALDCEADFVSFGTDSITINWTNAPSSAWKIQVIAFQGLDNADVRSYNHLSGDADPKTHTVGFNPEFFYFVGIGSSTTDSVVADANLHIGMADFSAQNTKSGSIRAAHQASVAYWQDNPAGSKIVFKAFAQSSSIVDQITGGGARGVSIEIAGSLSSTSFDTTQAQSGNAYWYGLTLNFPANNRPGIAKYLSQAGTGDDTLAPGITNPSAALVISTDIDSSDEGVIVSDSTGGTMGFGAAAARSGFSIIQSGGYFADADLQNSNNETGFSDENFIHRAWDRGVATNVTTAAVTDFAGAGGVTINYSANHASNALFWVMWIKGTVSDQRASLGGIYQAGKNVLAG